MKTAAQIVNSIYDKNLLDDRKFRKDYRKITQLLEAYGLPFDGKSDDDVIQNEIIARSIEIKQRFEDVFFDTYVKMFDYWYDLSYQERKRQMNVDVDRFSDTLPCFETAEGKVYMPCFSERFNRLYHTEIVLLDLKQYHVFIRDFASEVARYRYGALPYQYGFSSAHFLRESEEGYIVYHPQSHRLYHYGQQGLQETLSLDPRCEIEDEHALTAIAEAFLAKDEEQLITLLIQSAYIGKKAHKRLVKYQKKWMKKQQKREKKEQKS